MSWYRLDALRGIPNMDETVFGNRGEIIVVTGSRHKEKTPIFAELARAHNERLGISEGGTWIPGSVEMYAVAS